MIQLKSYNNSVVVIGDATLTTSAPFNISRGGGRFGEPCIDKRTPYFTNLNIKRPLSKFAISLWIYKYSYGTWNPVVISNLNNSLLWEHGGRFIYYINYTEYFDIGSVELNKWTHIYIAQSNTQQFVYIDGVNVATYNVMQPRIETLSVLGMSKNYPVFSGKLSNLIIYEDYVPFHGVPTDLIGYSKTLFIREDKKVYKAGD